MQRKIETSLAKDRAARGRVALAFTLAAEDVGTGTIYTGPFYH